MFTAKEVLGGTTWRTGWCAKSGKCRFRCLFYRVKWTSENVDHPLMFMSVRGYITLVPILGVKYPNLVMGPFY